jgi:chorismate mutase
MQRYERFLTFFTLLILGMRVASGETGNPFRPLVETSAQRLLSAERVALAKWDSGAAVEDGPRAAKVIQSAVKDGNAMGLDSKQVEAFFRAQIEANKLVQYSLLTDWRREGRARCMLR